MARNLNDIDKALICDDIDSGLSLNQISIKRGFARRTVQRIAENLRNNILINWKHGSSRPKLLNDSMKQFIKNLHNMNSFISSREIIEKLNKEFNLKVSRPTISRFLNSLGLITNLALKKLY
ncbi:hypothetical protein A0H76_319 [Hepatospora eriocheir]|uniref:Transposase Tc1-like domain-containing protein n=1 Tax=Hepatospora eriocheir TaxID=1081669 RepID=A0A1X0QIW5_9MICR|nr:hypothetical protein A0H76_319 [Hepatospora eriocheir]